MSGFFWQLSIEPLTHLRDSRKIVGFLFHFFCAMSWIEVQKHDKNSSFSVQQSVRIESNKIVAKHEFFDCARVWHKFLLGVETLPTWRLVHSLFVYIISFVLVHILDLLKVYEVPWHSTRAHCSRRY